MVISVTLSPAMSKLVQDRIDNGLYPDATAVVEAALSDYEQDVEMELWLKDVVAPTYDSWKKAPSDVISGDELRSRLRTHIASRLARSA